MIGDLGLTKLFDAMRKSSISIGVGTIMYMSPEFIRSETVYFTSDIW